MQILYLALTFYLYALHLQAVSNNLIATFNIQIYGDQTLQYFEDVWAVTVAGETIDTGMEFDI